VAQQRERFTVENELDEIVNATVDAPATRRYLTNPNNLQVSRNDAGRLAALERAAAKMNGVYGDEEEDTSLLGYFWQYAKGVVSDIASGNVAESERWNPDDTDSRLRFEMSLNGVDRADLFRVRSELMRSGMSESEAAAEAMRRTLADRREYWQGVADDPDFAVDEAYRNPQTFAEKVFAAAGGTAPGMAATVINPVAGTLAMTQQIYGSEYRSLVASGADPKAASDAAFISSLAQMPLEFAGNMIQLNAAAKMLKAGPTRDFLVNLLQGGLSEGLEEYLQQAPGLYGEIRAHNPDWTQEQIFAEFFRKLPEHMASAESGEAFLIGGTLGMVLPGAAGAIRLPSAIREQKRIEANSAREQELLSALDETAQATETGQLSPEHLQAAVQAIRDQVGENVSTVYVDAEAFIGNLGEEAGAVAERVGISDQLDAAYSSGGLLEIPIAKYAAHIAAVPEINNALIEHRKFSPGSMTLAEQQAYFASQQEEMQRLMDVVAEEQAAADVIEQEAADVVKDLTEKLKATGRIKGKERDNAVLYAARLATLARRSGGQYSVKELYETYGPILGDSLADVTVKSEGRMMEQAAVSAETAGADVNNAAEVEEAARLWREQGTESPYFKRWADGRQVFEVYHGTGAEFDAFDTSDRSMDLSARNPLGENIGSFFASKERDAKRFGPNVGKYYVGLKNPMFFKTQEDFRAFMRENSGMTPDVRDAEGFIISEGRFENNMRKAIESAGHDGVVILNPQYSAKKDKPWVVAFDPTQIKSVNNRGTFDANDPRILMQQSAETAGATTAAEVAEAQRMWAEMGTESPYFKRWFGDSKVVDDEGKPLVVYHGTTADFDAFDLGFAGADGVLYSTPAIFATSDPNLASDYAVNKFDRVIADAMRDLQKFKNENPGTYDERYETAYGALKKAFRDVKGAGRPETGGGANVMPLYMALEKPLVLDADGKRFMEVMPDAIARAVAEGNDGVIVNRVRDHASPASDYPAQVLIAFRPEQIKSATGNRGTFDPSDARIMYQSAGALAGAETESNVAELNGVVSRKVEMANLEGKSLTELADLLVEFHEQPDDVAFGQGEYLAALNKTLASAFTKKFDALEVNQPDGTVLMLHKSSKEGVNWQVTTLSKDGIPWGDTPFNTKKDAVLHFIHSADPKALADGIRRGTGEDASPGGVLRQPTQDTSRGLVRFEDGRIMYQSAFHGSPYRFDNFTLDAIGTGEGAQAYGWGLYFAGRKDVAEFYRRTLGVTKYLSENQFNQDGTPNRTNQVAFQIDAGVAREDILDGLEALGHSKDDALQILRDAQTLFKDLDTGAGQLYEVDIPEDDVMLHWDRPLSAQPEKVREALGKLMAKRKYKIAETKRGYFVVQDQFGETVGRPEEHPANLEETLAYYKENPKPIIGSALYTHLTKKMRSDKAASEYLNSLGIKGIKYLDGTSRAAGEGSYNYVIFDDNAIEILNTFYQAKEVRPKLQNMQDYARGATFFANSVVRGKTGQPLVALFKHSDESTFMHEAGHVFLEMTRHLATQPGAHPEIVREWQDIKAALGIPNDGKIKAEHHEAFAEALEKYLAQGKAPSMKLRHVFERFFAWMRSVYRSWVSEGVTPDERLVPIFDRMFATDAEIAEVEEYYAAQKPFFTAAEMQDKDEQDRYLKRIKAAQESAREKQFRRYWNAYKKALGGKKRFEEEAKTEVDAMPVYAAADEAVSKGGFSGEDLDYMIGNDLRAELAKKRPGLVTKKGGAAPESVALKYGYDSVQDMVADILNAESKTEAVANRVKHALIAEEQRLRKGLQERGELNGDEAFHGAEQLAVLAAEFEMAQARARGRKAVEKAAKDFTPPEAVQADARAKAQEAADRFHAAWKTKDAKELRAFVRATLDAMQSYQTLAALKEAPLDRDHLVKYYGRDTVTDLDAKHPGIIKKGSGRAADDAATELGYADTDALISMLQDTEPRKAAYDSMLAEYEAEFRSDTFDEEAKVFADTYQRFVDSDPRTALARAEYNDRVMLAAGKPSRVEVAAVRAVARKMLAGRKVKDAMNPAKFQTQERKAANAALAAKAKGDMDAALEWKRRQLLNHALVIESMKIREERAATVARLKRALKRDIADTYNAQVVSLLSTFKLTGREAKEGTPTLEAFLESIQNSATDSPFMGAVPDLPRWLFDGSKIPAGGATLADTLTVDEMRELDAAVKWLVETGYDIKQGRLAAYNEHIKDLVAKLTEPMRELKDKRVVSKRFETWRRLSDATREYFADHNMLIFVLDALDGYTNVGKKGSFGPNRRTIGNALADRQSERDKRMGEASEKLKPIMAQFAESMRKHPKILRTTVPVPEVMREDGDFWNFPKVLAVALNMGNATNMQRVMEGYELTPEQLTELTSVLSPEDWNAVQQVWDTLNEYWVDMNDVHKRTYHFEMNKVKADPITVRASDGSQVRLRGGYYPIKFNPRYARQVGAWSEKDDLMQDSVFGHPATKSGMTKDRKGAGVRLPVLLDISVLYGHIEDSIHFITHADLIRDLDRITQNTEFQNTVRQKMGREVAEMFRPMLRHIARPERQMNVVIERGFDRMRAMSTAYILGLNTSVALKQVFSLPGIWHDIGMSNYAKGLIHVMRNPVQAYHAMREASTYMATRSDSFDRDLKDSLGRMSGGRMSRGYLDVARDWAFALIRLMDFVAVYPSWHGAYKLGLEKEGGHEGAVRFADEMIRQSQPSSKPMDMSKIQYKRGGLFKAMSMFMTFTAKYGNRQRHFARAYFKDKKITTREYAWHLMLEAVAPPVLMNLMFAAIWGDEPDEKDMLIDVISYQFSGYVLLRDIAGVASAAVKHSALDKDVFKPNLDRVPALTGLTLAERAVTNTVKWVADMDDEDARNKAFLDVAELLSFFAGVPAPKLARKLAKGYEQFEDDGNPLLLVVPDYSRD
jgi:hypothetical protein